MVIRLLPPDSSAAEMAAFEAVCRQLGGFDPSLDAEWIDGFLTAVAAGPRELPAEAWLPALADDNFDRTFADPDSHAAALAALQARLRVLRLQLDAEALFDDPDALRLNPWFGADDGQDALPLGALWAGGFAEAMTALPSLWTLPDGAAPELAQLFAAAQARIEALDSVPGPAETEAVTDTGAGADSNPGAARDALIDEALMSVQDLRLLWVELAPRPETRRVEATPGRNEPCPCGSGKKFKRCHGA